MTGPYLKPCYSCGEDAPVRSLKYSKVKCRTCREIGLGGNARPYTGKDTGVRLICNCGKDLYIDLRGNKYVWCLDCLHIPREERIRCLHMR